MNAVEDTGTKKPEENGIPSVIVKVHRLRALTEREGNRLAQALNLMVREEGADFHGVPALRTILAALVVFVDEGCGTAYTDCHCRIGISPELLDENKTPLATLAFALMHETLHNTQRHHARLDEKGFSPEVSNVAGDLEINGMIVEGCMGIELEAPVAEQYGKWRLTPFFRDNGTPGLLFPGIGHFSDYELYATAEQYAAQLKDDPVMALFHHRAIRIDVAVTGNGNWIGPMEDLDDETRRARFDEADRLGFHPLPPAEEARIREQTLHDIEDTLNRRGYGSTPMRSLLSFMAEGLKPPVIDWRLILAHTAAHSVQTMTRGRAEYSYRLPNLRRAAMSNAIFPGFVKAEPRLVIALDTSGSMGRQQCLNALAEIEGICRTVADPSFFCIDVEAKGEPRLFHSAYELMDKLEGGGGTDMAAAVDAAAAMPPDSKPNILVIVTDGEFDWAKLRHSLEQREARRMAIIVVIVNSYFPDQSTMLAKEDDLRRVHPHTSIIQTRFS
ncbi:DUF2201 family putative metallopeptidase [Bifidobacterium choloepi]|uniref:VWA domain-containing protein n=1 Tax=Bifidobacterium choloepi TaxID=2614131 RepID=A0A6I5N5X0_9BIFI|nr:VWA-like domain-containing protein [Bifidobacterium choloepi]NEG69171.1 hypothetical protein [Bifidobacterium choloepi]